MPTFWLFGSIAWNQSKGLILSRSSCHGQKRQWYFLRIFFCIDTAWIYKTVQFNAALLWAVFELQYFLRVDCVMSVTIRQFARKILLNSKLRKRFRLLDWLNWIACNKLVFEATLHINWQVKRSGSLFLSFFFAWFVKFSIGVAVVVHNFNCVFEDDYCNSNNQILGILFKDFDL
jgi:hypothetical protein